MNVGRAVRALWVFAMVLMPGMSPAWSASDDLLKLVPADWPVVARVDVSPSNASGAYLHSFEKDPQYVESVQAAARGVAKIIAAMGIEIDPQKGIAPWRGEQMAMGMDVSGKETPHIVLAIASKDRQLASKSLYDAVGSVARSSEPVVQQIGGAEVYVWELPKESMKPTYAVGDGFVLFGESLDSIKAALAAGAAGSMPAAAQWLKPHADDLLAFAVDTGKLVSSLVKVNPGEGEERAAMAAMAGTVNPHGGLRLSDGGAVLSVFGKVPPMMLMMASALVTKTEPAANVVEMLPGNALAAVTAAAAQMTAPLQQKMGEAGASEFDLASAALLLASAKEAPAGVAIMSLIPSPGYVVAVRAGDEAGARAILSDFESGLAKAGLRKGAARQAAGADGPVQEIVSVKEGEAAGYICQVGDGVVFGSDWRSAQKAAQVTQATSLASSPSYTGAMGLMPGGHVADAWMNLSVVSAMGDLYEAMGARYTSPITKWITDSLKGTNGLGAAVSLGEDEARLQVALGTTIGPGTPVMGLAALMGAGSLLVTLGRETVLEDIFGGGEKARSSVSMSNLKQLAVALNMYAADWDSKLPPAGTWPKALEPYVRDGDVFRTPWADQGVVYKFNAKLGGLNTKDILNPAEVIAFFEWDTSVPLNPNVIAGADGAMRVAYLDGHVVTLKLPPGAKAFTPQLKKHAPAKKPAGKR